jgi:hypothetical protein
MGIMQSTTQSTNWEFNFYNCRIRGYVPIHWGWANGNLLQTCELTGNYAANSMVVMSAVSPDSSSIQKITWIECLFSQTQTVTNQIHYLNDNGTAATFLNLVIGGSSEQGNNLVAFNTTTDVPNSILPCTGSTIAFKSHFVERISGQLLVGENAAAAYTQWEINGRWGQGVNVSDLLTQRGTRTTVTIADIFYPSTGGGISFQASNTLLNNYAEGTFTAALVCGTSGTITLTASTGDTLTYTQIGKEIFFDGLLLVDSVSSPVGSLTLTGLPATVPNRNRNRSSVTVIPSTWNASLTTPVGGSLIPNTTTCLIKKFQNGGFDADCAGDVQAGAGLHISGQYSLA